MGSKLLKRCAPLWALLWITVTPISGAGESPSVVSPPPALADSAWSHLCRYVGRSFASRYVTRDTTAAIYIPAESLETDRRYRRSSWPGPKRPYWSFRFQFRMAAKPWVDEIIVVNVHPDGSPVADISETGRPLPEGGIQGIGDCAAHPERCVFPIDRERAIQIARQSGFEEGIAPWKTDFHWYHGADGRFVWLITNQLRENGGKDLVIDANTGAVFKRLEWSEVP